MPITFDSSIILTMDPGELRTEIEIQERMATTNVTGEETATWVTVAGPVMARIETYGGGEYTRADRTEARATHRVTLRYLDTLDVTAVMRVHLILADTYLNVILATDVQYRNAVLSLLCAEER